jgi:putative transposase
MRVLVHPANEQDIVAAKWLLKRVPFVTRLALFLFDSGYDSPALLHWCQQVFGVRTEVTHRGAATGFEVQPIRWIVERTFGWLNRFRRLSKDYEQRPEVSEGFIYLAMSHLMLRRLTRPI